MTVKFYKNNSDKMEVDKSLTQCGSDISNCAIKEDVSITDPIFYLKDYTGFNVATANYCYIDTLARYYYITDIIVVDNTLCEIHCHVDVLMSFKSGIRSNTAVIARQQSLRDLYLNDGVFKCKAYPKFDIIKFPTGFSGYHYVLTVAGS